MRVSNPTHPGNSAAAGVSGVPALPTPWQDADLGYVGYPGSATLSGVVFSVTASGGDVWEAADSFNFAYRALTGDGWISARVLSLDNQDPWIKAGVMIRESLSPGAANALVALTGGHGVTFQRRTATGASSVNTLGVAVAAPYWVKLVRSGSALSGYQSSDGTNWQLVISDTISMTQTVWMGLATTAHNNANIIRASFDQVSVQGATVAPSIITQPLSQPIDRGQSVTLTVAATGTAPLVYAWFEGLSGDTQHSVGGNASQLATPPLGATAHYWVRVSNAAGGADSDTASLALTQDVYLPLILR